MECGALRVGLGCGGEGGIGQTLVLYLRGAGVAATEAWDAVAASAGPKARLPEVAIGAATAVVATTVATTAVVAIIVAEVALLGGGAAAATGPGLEPLAGGEEDCLTLDRKLCPSRVFTMAGLEKEK